ncbi:hypothetical protein IKW75_02525 [Candidatus Saccharibacteria bacterium]|nr:hypothetical protein [Candidatus Saccharibacteria bacterium]
MSATSKKPGMTICGIAVVIFVAFVGFTAFSVNRLAAQVDDTTIANIDGVPSIWNEYRSASTITSRTEAEVKDGYVAYTTAVTNTSYDSSTSITHIASYINGGTKGFVPLDTNSLEYSYYPDAIGSWTPIAVTAPGESAEDFKLSSEIHLGTSGSSDSTVYFRYFVSPSTYGTINDKIAFIARTDSGSEVSVSDTTIAYEETSTETVAVAEEDKTGESAFAEPLGVTSETPSITAVSTATIGAIAISSDVVTGSLIALVVCLGIFVFSLIAYLISRKKEEQRHRLF